MCADVIIVIIIIVHLLDSHVDTLSLGLVLDRLCVDFLEELHGELEGSLVRAADALEVEGVLLNL